MYVVCLSDRLGLEGVCKLALTFALHEQVLELRCGPSELEVEHLERKVLSVRVGCGMARRGRGRLLGDPVFLKRVGERVGENECQERVGVKLWRTLTSEQIVG